MCVLDYIMKIFEVKFWLIFDNCFFTFYHKYCIDCVFKINAVYCKCVQSCFREMSVWHNVTLTQNARLAEIMTSPWFWRVCVDILCSFQSGQMINFLRLLVYLLKSNLFKKSFTSLIISLQSCIYHRISKVKDAVFIIFVFRWEAAAKQRWRCC